MQHEHLLVGLGELRADAVGQADAHRASDAGVQPVARLESRDVLASDVQDLVAVHRDDGVAVEELTDLLAKAHRVHRSLVGVPQRGTLRGTLVFDFAKAQDPVGLDAACPVGLSVPGLLEQLRHDRFGIADDA